MRQFSKQTGRRLLIALFWVMVWQLAAIAIHNSIILAGPWETGAALWRMLPTEEFWKSIACSFAKISLGFGAAFVVGLGLGSGGYCFPILGELVEPLMALLKSIPVASFVILALIWAGSANLSVLIAFLVVLPVIYIHTVAGLESTDEKLLEMAKVFSMSPWKQIRYIYIPALMPYLRSGCGVALGMSWKSGVAAEVIGVPDHSIGEKLYMSKIYLNTGDLMAWTFVIIVISALFEKAVLRLLSGKRIEGGDYES